MKKILFSIIVSCIVVLTTQTIIFSATALSWPITVTIVGGEPPIAEIPDENLFWTDEFEGTPGVQPSGWTDATDVPAFNADITYATESSQADVTVVASGPGYGQVHSQYFYVNADTYPVVEIDVSEVDSGTFWKVGIQEDEGGYTYWDLNTDSNESGVFQFDYKTVTGWTGTHRFKIQIVVIGSTGNFIKAESISLIRTPQIIWGDEFEGTSGTQPTDWQDETDNTAFNAELAYSSIGSYAAVTPTGDDLWGKVLSPIINCDVDEYPVIEVNVANVNGASWKVGIQEEEGSYLYHDLNTDTTETGVLRFNYSSLLTWSGSHTFRVQLAIVGAINTSVELDSVKVMKVPVQIWGDEFEGTSGTQPTDWQDETDNTAFNAELAYSSIGSYAAVTPTGDDLWGKVLSPIINCDVDEYPVIEVNVANVNGASWKVGIQEEEGSYLYHDLNTDTIETGVLRFNYNSLLTWSGSHTFRVQLTIIGAVNTSVEFDSVKVIQVPDVYWVDDLIGTAPNQAIGWMDESDDINFDADVAYSYNYSKVAITRTAQSTWGKVLSPAITVDPTVYPMVEIEVDGLSASTQWKISIQEDEGGYSNWDLNSDTSEVGSFAFDYRTITGWTSSANHRFKVQITVVGGGGQNALVDRVQIYRVP